MSDPKVSETKAGWGGPAKILTLQTLMDCEDRPCLETLLC